MEPECGLALSRFRPELLGRATRQVEAVSEAGLRFGVYEIRVRGVERAVESVAPLDVDPVLVEDRVLGGGGAGADPIEIVLQAAADAEGSAVVDRYPIELAD